MKIALRNLFSYFKPSGKKCKIMSIQHFELFIYARGVNDTYPIHFA
jgi:hypothetical protein